jgi:hypothetical protein
VDRPAAKSVPPQPPADLLGQVQEPRPQHLQVVDVPLEGRLMGDRRGLPFGHDGPLVDPAGQLPEMFATGAEVGLERLQRIIGRTLLLRLVFSHGSTP